MNTYEYTEKLKLRHGNHFTVLGEYTKSNQPIKIKCNLCGRESLVMADRLMMRGACRGCFDKRHTKTHEYFIKQISDIFKGDITVLGQYVYDRQKIMVRHNTCGAEYEIIPSALLQGKLGCRSCLGERLKVLFAKKQDIFIKELKDKTDDAYEVIDKYQNAHTKIMVRHKICGYEWKVQPIHLLRYKPCPYCFRARLKSKNPELQKIVRNIRSRVIHVLREQKKSIPTLKLIGCRSREELQQYIESLWVDGMNWENYGGKRGWQVDHIRPCASFDLEDPEQLKQCFHYSNLRPLWGKDNRNKSSIFNGNKYRIGGAIWR